MATTKDGTDSADTATVGDTNRRASELRELHDDELATRLAESKVELFNLRFQTATGALENSARLGGVKREIARILTIRHQRAATVGRT
jgi:large subunit ribosomal protein L29